MEYGTQIMWDSPQANFNPNSPVFKDKICDDNFMRYVGFQENNDCIKYYFSNDTVKTISCKLTELLQGVDPHGRNIVVPDNTICSVMSQIYQSFRPQTGDIYGRYNIPSYQPENYVQNMIDQVIEVIVSDVRNNLGMDEINSKLNIFNTILGDFNVNGLRSHPVIKIRKRNTNFRGMVSFMK